MSAVENEIGDATAVTVIRLVENEIGDATAVTVIRLLR